ncbi:MAG: hypothetical protein ACREQ5_06010 [Candidatus Dormibacteria bacterium]
MFKKYPQMKLKMQREAVEKLNRQAHEMTAQTTAPVPGTKSFAAVLTQL